MWALFRIGFPALLLLFERQEQTAEPKATSWYGERWLALWYPLEPTREPARSVQRHSSHLRVARHGIFGVLPLARAVINGTLAPAHEFAWQLATI
jgi:hypothetical protein